MTTAHYDTLETRSPETREREQMQALRTHLTVAQAHATALAKQLSGIHIHELHGYADLVKIPVVRKSELLAAQQAARDNGSDPFAGYAVASYGTHAANTKIYAHKVFASPGPIYEPEGASRDYQRVARALHAAGVKRGDLLHNSFSYHMTPGAWILDAGAEAIGAAVFPAGVGQTEQQISAMRDLKPDGYVGTPSFLRILLEKAEELGTPITSLKKALVSGEYFPPQTRALFAERGITALQCYATADVGLIAYEALSAHQVQAGMFVDEGIIVEIVRPGTNTPVPAGEVGEVVVTTLNADYPLLRFGTGDLSALLAEPSACGRSGPRIKGWMGRADQTAKVKGMFVHPAQIAQICARHPEISRARLIITNPEQRDLMHLQFEAQGSVAEASLLASIRDITKLSSTVEAMPAGALANDGKVIDDLRVYT
ncbi:MAG: hypothetical protein RLZZ502_111 [Pseudomonadota bacterium]